LVLATEITSPDKAMTSVVTGAELFLPLEGLINIDEEIKRLEKELDKLDKEVERVQKKLSNEGFVKKAPQKVIEEEQAKEKDYLEKRETVRERISELRG
ncbi:hypothetical protein NXY55_27440, partial [Aeromonas veronii]|nr:hypothetical protein [Aeromonas veronii]